MDIFIIKRNIGKEESERILLCHPNPMMYHRIKDKGGIKMEDFWGWEGWNTISSICQIFLVLFSAVSIFITIFQIKHRRKLKMKVNIKTAKIKEIENISRYGVKQICSNKITEFSILNYGMDRIYIECCWAGTSKGKNKNSPFRGAEVMIEKFIEPGERYYLEKNLVKELLQSVYSKSERNHFYGNEMYFYVRSGTGEINTIKTRLKINYNLVELYHYMD